MRNNKKQRNKGRKEKDMVEIKSIRVGATVLLGKGDEGVCRHTDIRERYI